MYATILAFHNILRWVVLIGGLLAIGSALLGWQRKKTWTAVDSQFGLIFTIGMDVQLLLGLLLYFVLSPITQHAFANFAQVMRNANDRFFAVEHISIMVIAVVLAHVGRARSKKATTDVGKHKTAAIFFILALVAVLAGIPWQRPLFPTMF